MTSETFSQQKLARLKKKLGEDLTYSIFCQLREWEVGLEEIARMYGTSRSSLYKFVNRHKEVLNRESNRKSNIISTNY